MDTLSLSLAQTERRQRARAMLRPQYPHGATCLRAIPLEMVPCDFAIIVSQLKIRGALAVLA